MVLVYTRLADLNIIENSYGGGRSMKYDRCVQPRVLRSRPEKSKHQFFNRLRVNVINSKLPITVITRISTSLK